MYEMMQESGLTEVIPFNMYLSHLEPVSIFFSFFLIYISWVPQCSQYGVAAA